MPARVLYCHCAFARVVPPETKTAVLAYLVDADAPFDSVPDLCEMAARRDPRLAAFAEGGPLTIVACYERAVQGLFRSAGAPLPADGIRVLNMRTETADVVAAAIDQRDRTEAGAE
jgi:hypothetical protein